MLSLPKNVSGVILGPVLGRAILLDLLLPWQEDNSTILRIRYLKSR